MLRHGVDTALRRGVRCFVKTHSETARSMNTLHTDRLKSSRNDSRTENSTQTTRQPSVRQTSDGVALAAEPSYDREYNHLLTIEEAVHR